MSIEKEKLYYRKNIGTGEEVFSHCVRPSIQRNDLGPLPLNGVIKVKIYKNDVEQVNFQYTVVKAPLGNRVIYSAASFTFEEKPADTISLTPETIICVDEEIIVKDIQTDTISVDSIGRPRNILRDNIGPFALGDTCKVEFILNENIIDDFHYTITVPTDANKAIFAKGRIDFVEMN